MIGKRDGGSVFVGLLFQQFVKQLVRILQQRPDGYIKSLSQPVERLEVGTALVADDTGQVGGVHVAACGKCGCGDALLLKNLGQP